MTGILASICACEAQADGLGQCQDFGAGVGDQERVFKLGGALAVGCHGCPVVVPHFVLPSAKRDHRLNRERHAWSHYNRVS